MTREEILQEAHSWLRTPFHHHARVKGSGVDCAQFLLAVYDAVGLLREGDEVGEYAWDWHLHRDEEKYLENMMRRTVKVETPMPGDIALFRFGRCVSHGAIVIEWPMVIHAYVGRGVIISNAELDAELKGRLHSFWSVFGREV